MTASFSPAALAAFELFFRPWMRRRVRAVRLAGLPRELPPGLPLLLASNHVSWWDGFVLREVHRALRPRAPLHTVMLARELESHPFFARLGAVGIEPGSATSVARAVRGLRRRLEARPDAVVAFFPQGRILPSYRRPLGFRPGVELLARHLPPLALLPVAIHLEPLNAPAPTVFVAAGAPILTAERRPDAREVEAAVEEQLDRTFALLARHGEAAPLHWPGLHEPLPRPDGAPWPA